jgi:hypothetical protein
MNLKQRPAIVLSTLIVILAILASASGLLLNGLYRDNAFVITTWLGNDAVTLFLATPILIAAVVLSARGSLKAQLMWLGALDYMLYNYAFYLFGTAFNAFFLVYAALVALTIFALIFGLANLDIKAIRQQFSPRTPVKWISAYFLFVAAGLGLIYVAQSVAFIVSGQVPSIVAITEHPTNVVFALDLTLLIPWLIVGAIWLMQRRTWGYVIAGILSIKGPLYTLVLAVNSILVVNRGLSKTSELPLWGLLTFFGLAAGVFLYHPMNSKFIELVPQKGD